jgi:purine-binding chemotaxis protein CheW
MGNHYQRRRAASRRPFPGRFTGVNPSRSVLAVPNSSSQQLVVFSLGSEQYALPIGAVHEIIRYTEPVSNGASQAGVLVDDVDQVLTVTEDQLEDVRTAGADSIEAIAKIGDRLVVLLNADGLFVHAAVEEPAAA